MVSQLIFLVYLMIFLVFVSLEFFKLKKLN
jgi:hypothetical protein